MRKPRNYLENDDDLMPEASPDYLSPELRSVLGARRPAEDLNLRRLLEFPETIAPRSRGFRTGRFTRFPDPDWPDAA